MDAEHPLAGAADRWEQVVADMEATADEYREAGWEVLELHPGDVTPLPAGVSEGQGPSGDRMESGDDEDGRFVDDRVGLDVLVPGDEFRETEEVVEDTAFDEYEAFRAAENDVVFLVVATKAEEAGRVVIFPLYYRVSEAGEMVDRVRAEGEMQVFVRPLSDENRVVFTQTEPETLLP